MRCISLAALVVTSTLLAQTQTSKSNSEVGEVSATGFQIKMSIPVKASSKDVYDSFVNDISQWWDKSHTYSSDSKNLSVETKPHGWFLEKLPAGGFVRHFDIVYLAPGKTIRLEGGMGPLQEQGVTGAMTIHFKSIDADNSTIDLTYNVGGFMPGGQKSFQQWAPIVKQVVTEQMQRLQKFAEKKALESA